MPAVARRRTVGAPPADVWELVSDPRRLPEWWPGVERVEDASHEVWTTVHRTRRGREVRADFTRVIAERPRRLAWRQELEATPFERFLVEASIEASLTPDGPHTTLVELRGAQRARGASRFGGLMLRRALRRQLDGALDGLGRAVAPAPRPDPSGDGGDA